MFIKYLIIKYLAKRSLVGNVVIIKYHGYETVSKRCNGICEARMVSLSSVNGYNNNYSSVRSPLSWLANKS